MLLLLVCLAGGSPDVAADELNSPLEPEATLAHFQLDPGMEIQLVACEPDVIDPVAIRFDARGRMWVVEMRDYPHGPADGKPPLSKIRVLTDTDGDGRYETSQTFAEELLFATGLQPWRDGALVTLAGEVAYLEDTDGDGRADRRETWYRGFATKNPQLRANHPRFGPDNLIYIANGLRGGAVVDARCDDAQPVSISGRDFRFDARSGRYEAISGSGQYGLVFDAAGNRFVCSNRQPLDHVVLESRYLERNPLLAVRAVQTAVAAAGEDSRVHPLTSAWTTSNLHAGQFTAACGIEIERGSVLGEAYQGNAFTCEPTGSLVHREVITPHGATFRGTAASPGREFLASPDAWFRPVNLEWGPDGALYVVDMYRAVIEHPQFMPTELQERPDLRLGDDRGRIYRIVPQDFQQPDAANLSSATTGELVAALAAPHAWQRETALRMLYERQDQQARGPLEAMAGKHPKADARLAALQVLAGLDALSVETIAAALEDDSPRVRERAVLLAEDRLASDESLRERVVRMAEDSDPRLRFQVALSLGGVKTADVIDPLAKIMLAQASDPWTRYAVATARPESIAHVLEAVLRDISPESPGSDSGSSDASPLQAVRELAAIVGGRRDPDEVAQLVRTACAGESLEPAVRRTALLGLAEGCARRGDPLLAVVARLPDAPALQTMLADFFDRQATRALDSSLDEGQRHAALELLAHAESRAAAEACLRLVTQDPSQTLRVRAAASLAGQAEARIAATLLESYANQSPRVRAAIREALAGHREAAEQLLDAINAGRVARAELGRPLEDRLRNHPDEAVRKQAAKVLTREVPAERQAVLAEYQQALELTGDPLAGRKLFRQHCSTCHRIGEIGVNVAPDISDSRVKTPSQLLTDILNPNQAIDNNYVSYTVAMADGNVHTGIISAETASSITLRQPEDKTLTLLRADIEALRSSGVSLMPEGFEKHLTPAQLADLIGFVKNWRYLTESIPGTLEARPDR